MAIIKSCAHETEGCRNNVHCLTCEHYDVGNLTTTIDTIDTIDKRLIIERFETIKENFLQKMRKNQCLDKKGISYLFDKLIKEIEIIE